MRKLIKQTEINQNRKPFSSAESYNLITNEFVDRDETLNLFPFT